MNDLTEKEKAIFDFLKEKTKASADEIMAMLKRKRIAPKDRKSLIQWIKTLGFKTAQSGYIITMTSGIGRGVKAQYELTKKF